MTWYDDNCIDDNEYDTLLDVHVVHTTARALLIKNSDGNKHWIPRSVVVTGGDIGSEAIEGAKGDICIAQWFAEKEGPFE